MKKNTNMFAERLTEFIVYCRRQRLATVIVANEHNIRALTGVQCDSGILRISPLTEKIIFYTDFRYIPMVHRVAPWLPAADMRDFRIEGNRIGYESTISAKEYLRMKAMTKRASFIDISEELYRLRSRKTPEEIAAIRAAERLNDEIWQFAARTFSPGMTEQAMARIIRHEMIERGDGEAFETIVCIGKNAAECHHIPDQTKWNGKEPILVDMGVKLDGYCSDMTRNILPDRLSRFYLKAYEAVLEANRLAIAAARPGITGKELDAVARNYLGSAGLGSAFGHSLGHGVGLQIHEAPYASPRSLDVLEPGMLITIEPGVYFEDNCGIRIEDLVLITEQGCEVLSSSPK